MRETVPSAPVDEDAASFVHLRHIHGGTLHFRVGKPELTVNVVYVLEEFREVATCCPDRNIVSESKSDIWTFQEEDKSVLPKITKEFNETLPKEAHEAVVGRGGDCGQSRSEGRHDVVRVDLVGVEDCVFAVSKVKDLLPNIFAVF